MLPGAHPNSCPDLGFVPTASYPSSIQLFLSRHKDSALAGCWGSEAEPPLPIHQAPSCTPIPGCDAAPCAGSRAHGCSWHPPRLLAGEGFLGAGWAPGSGLGTNNGSPSVWLPGAPGSSSSRSAHAAAHPRLRQGNTCARRSPRRRPPRSQPRRRGGCRQLLPGNWAAAPPTSNPRGGGFSRACSCIELCRTPCTAPGASTAPTAPAPCLCGGCSPS